MEAKASDGSIIKTGDIVLIRHGDGHVWSISIFGSMSSDNKGYECANYKLMEQCIPLNGNEHLCGTRDNIEEPYSPKFGDKVEGITCEDEKVFGILVAFNDDAERSCKSYVVLKERYTNGGFVSKYHKCKSVKPIKE